MLSKACNVEIELLNNPIFITPNPHLKIGAALFPGLCSPAGYSEARFMAPQ